MGKMSQAEIEQAIEDSGEVSGEVSAEEMEQRAEEHFAAGFSGETVKNREEPEPREEDDPDPEAPESEAAELSGEQMEHDDGKGDAGESDPLAGLSPETIAALEARIAPTLSQKIEERLSGRIRNIEGHIGGLNKRVNEVAAAREAAAAQGADSPSNTRVREAMEDGEKMKLLREDFPEFAEALDELRGSMVPQSTEANAKAIDERFQNVATVDQVTRVREMMKLDTRFPDWEDTVQSESYRNWLLNQPQDIQQLTESESARDALKVLEKFKADTAPPAPATDAGREAASNAAQAKSSRLESAVAPTNGKSVVRPATKTAEEAFEEGFYS